MKFFTNKKFLFKLIATLCMSCAIFGLFIIPNVQAVDGQMVSVVGGKLLDPICDLLCSIGDGIMEILQKVTMGTSATSIFDNKSGAWWSTVLLAVLVIAAAVAVAYIGGVALVVKACTAVGKAAVKIWAASKVKIIAGAILVPVVNAATGGIITTAASLVGANLMGDYIVMPTYTIGPEEIFAGRILLFDADVFNPKDVYVNIERKTVSGEKYVVKFGESSDITIDKSMMTNDDCIEIKGIKYYKNDIQEQLWTTYVGADLSFKFNDITYTYNGDTGTWSGPDGGYGVIATETSEGTKIPPILLEEWNEKDKNTGEYINTYRQNGYEAESYFYYKNGDSKDNSEDNIVKTSANNAALELKDTIAKWYYVIRNVALIGLALVLLYVGIRMLLSSIAAEKAKYKQMMGDWVVALCLVFLMQYIMVFAHSFVDSITNIFAGASSGNMHMAVIADASEKLKNEIRNVNEGYVSEDGIITWPTNLMGRIRVESQQHDGTTAYVGYTICYVVLVMYTVFFAFTYAKRLLYLLFLTVIAPLVALTYPLDKMRDGQAQAFQTWMKEYIINLLIQPFHLILYTIFVSMAFDLAGTNILYSLVVIGFMMPAEKFLRSMFGFNRASSAGFLDGAAGAAVAFTAMQSLGKFANGKGNGGNKEKGGNSSEGKKSKIRSADDGFSTDKAMQDAIDDNNSTINLVDDGSSENAGGDLHGDTSDSNHRLIGGANSEKEALENQMDDMNINSDPYLENSNEHFNAQQRLNEINNNDEGSESSEESDTSNEGGEQQSQNNNDNQMGYWTARWENFRDDNLNKKKISGIAKSAAIKTAQFGLGATTAGLGIAAGIASGSLGNTFKYGVGAAYTGSAIGKGLGNRTISSYEKGKQKHEEAKMRQLGVDEYERQQNAKMDAKFMKDKEARKFFEMHLNIKDKEELDKVMSDALEYRKYGITDNETIVKAMKLNSNNRKDKMSIAAAKLASSARDQKGLKTTMDRFKEKPRVTKNQIKTMESYLKKMNNI